MIDIEDGSVATSLDAAEFLNGLEDLPSYFTVVGVSSQPEGNEKTFHSLRAVRKGCMSCGLKLRDTGRHTGVYSERRTKVHPGDFHK